MAVGTYYAIRDVYTVNFYFRHKQVDGKNRETLFKAIRNWRKQHGSRNGRWYFVSGVWNGYRLIDGRQTSLILFPVETSR